MTIRIKTRHDNFVFEMSERDFKQHLASDDEALLAFVRQQAVNKKSRVTIEEADVLFGDILPLYEQGTCVLLNLEDGSEIPQRALQKKYRVIDMGGPVRPEYNDYFYQGKKVFTVHPGMFG